MKGFSPFWLIVWWLTGPGLRELPAVGVLTPPPPRDPITVRGHPLPSFRGLFAFNSSQMQVFLEQLPLGYWKQSEMVGWTPSSLVGGGMASDWWEGAKRTQPPILCSWALTNPLFTNPCRNGLKSLPRNLVWSHTLSHPASPASPGTRNMGLAELSSQCPSWGTWPRKTSWVKGAWSQAPWRTCHPALQRISTQEASSGPEQWDASYVECDLFIFNWKIIAPQGFPDGSDGKESACGTEDQGSISGSGRSPGEGNGNPLQYSCLENPMVGGP